MKQVLQEALSALGLCLRDEQLEACCLYGRQLAEKNAVMNLTAITDPGEMARLHFADCLALLTLAELEGKRVIDVGCGAGFPGIPLKIGAPTMELTLLDSTAKKLAWISEELLPALGLQAQCLAGRAEELIQGRRECYDVAVSRAVARLPMLCELCLPFVKVGGVFLAMKGAAADDEAQEAEAAIRLLGGKMERIAQYPIGDAMHRVIIIRKLRPTPAKYPRRFAKIKQQPL